MIWSALAALALLQEPPSWDTQAAAKAHLESKQVVGMSVAVSVHGRLRYSEAFGWKDREKKVAATEGTTYRLGSVSKPVTAVAIMKEVEAKKLDLDKDVREYVKEWPEDKPGITLRLIMTHTSGLRHYKLGEKEVFDHYNSAADALALFKDDPLIAPTGTKYSYSTHAWTLAAAVLESATGKKMPALTGPLGIECEDLTKPVPPAASELYGRVGPNPPHYTKREDNSWKYAGGGMVSTAGRLALFAGDFMEGKLVSPATFDLMLTPVGGAAGEGQGLAWRVSGTKFNHTGAQQGCSAALFCDRKTGVAVAVLCNTENAAPGELAQKVLALWNAERQ